MKIRSLFYVNNIVLREKTNKNERGDEAIRENLTKKKMRLGTEKSNVTEFRKGGRREEKISLKWQL